MKCRCWLIYSIPDAERNRRNIGFYLEKGADLGIKVELLYREYIKIGVSGGKLSVSYEGSEVTLPDFAVCRTIDPQLSRQLERLGVPVFNSSRVAEITGDKARTYQFFAGSVPMPDTLFFRWHETPEKGALACPLVAKPCCGRGGYEVKLVGDERELEGYCRERRERREDFVLQKLAGRPGYDLRVYVIGREPVAAMLRSAAGDDIRANFCLGGRAEVYRLSEDEKSLVCRIAEALEPGFIGVDFLFDADGGLLLNEIEDVVGARMLYTFTDVDPVARYLEFILKKLNI